MFCLLAPQSLCVCMFVISELYIACLEVSSARVGARVQSPGYVMKSLLVTVVDQVVVDGEVTLRVIRSEGSRARHPYRLLQR